MYNARLLKGGLHNIGPVGHMWPTRSFLAVRESFFICRKCCKSPTSDNRPFRESSTLQRNRLCGRQRIHVAQVGPSTFLRCAGLAKRHWFAAEVPFTILRVLRANTFFNIPLKMHFQNVVKPWSTLRWVRHLVPQIVFLSRKPTKIGKSYFKASLTGCGSVSLNRWSTLTQSNRCELLSYISWHCSNPWSSLENVSTQH